MTICDPKKPKNQDFRACCPRSSLQNRQNGSAIVWILVMVALFAALSYIVSSGFRAGESNLSKEKVDLIVTEMLDYGQIVKQSVHSLQINNSSNKCGNTIAACIHLTLDTSISEQPTGYLYDKTLIIH